MRCKGVKEGVEAWPSAADLAARGEKVCEQEVKVEKEGSRRDVVATFRLQSTAVVTLVD